MESNRKSGFGGSLFHLTLIFRAAAKRTLNPWFFSLLLLCLVPANLKAQEVMAVAQEMPGFKPAMAYQNFGNGESVNIANGGLTVAHASSVSLPQNMGATLCPTRVYNTKSPEWAWSNGSVYDDLTDPTSHGALGMGWNISFGRVFLRLGEYDNGGGSCRATLPMYFFQDESGAEHRLYKKGEATEPYTGGGDVPSTDWYVTNDSSYLRARYEGSVWKIYYPDGSVRTAGGTTNQSYIPPMPSVKDLWCTNSWDHIVNPLTNGWYVTEIKDRAGNAITIEYRTFNQTTQPYAGAISKIKDRFYDILTNPSRLITFNYYPDTDADFRYLLKSISVGDMTETFTYLKYSYSTRPIPNPFLVMVHDSFGMDTVYDYAPYSGVVEVGGVFYPDPAGEQQLLSRIGYPTGAISSYAYGAYGFLYCRFRANPDQADCDAVQTTRVVRQHTLSLASLGSSSPISNTLTWTYERNPDWVPAPYLGRVHKSVPVLVKDPLGTMEAHFFSTADYFDPGQELTPGKEIAVIRYAPGTLGFSPADSAWRTDRVFETWKYYDYGDDDTKGDAKRCYEVCAYDAKPAGCEYVLGTKLSVRPVPRGNPRVWQVEEAEYAASSLIANWRKKTISVVWDGFGHYGITYTTDAGAEGLSSYPVTAVLYDLKTDFTTSLYQTDRATLTYSGSNSTDPDLIPTALTDSSIGEPQPPGSATFPFNALGEFKAVKSTYESTTGLLDVQTSCQSVQSSFTYNPNIATVLSAPSCSSGDKVLDVGYSNGNISQLKYSGCQQTEPPYTINFEWGYGMVKKMWWGSSSTDPEFTRAIEATTSRITSHADANAGLVTGFLYDTGGRLKKISPPGEPPEQIGYPTETKQWPVSTPTPQNINWIVGHAIKYYKGNLASIPTTLTPGGSVTAIGANDLYTLYTFDDLGRLWKTNTVVPATTSANRWTEQVTLYDPLGRATFSSDIYPFSSPKLSQDFNFPLRTGATAYKLTAPKGPTGVTCGTWSSPFGSTTLFPTDHATLDPFYRVRRVIKADGAVTETSYNGLDSEVTLTNIAGKDISGNDTPITSISTYTKDVIGRLLNVATREIKGGSTAGIGTQALYTYDGLGNLNKADLNGQMRYFTYDGLGRLKEAQQPETNNLRVYFNKYDSIGNLLEFKDANNVILKKDYDTKGRLEKVFTDAKTLQEWFYDTGGSDPQGVSYGGAYCKNRPTRAITYKDTGAGTVSEYFTYSGAGGQLTHKRISVAGISSYLPTRYYDLDYTFTDGLPTRERAYREGGAEATIDATFLQRTLQSRLFATDLEGVSGLQYNPSQALKQVTYTNNATAAFSEDPVMARLGSISVSGPSPSPLPNWTWETGSYQYDGAGNIKRIGQEEFSYDGLLRLRTAKARKDDPTSGAHYLKLSYNYDDWGNLLQRQVTSTTAELDWMAAGRSEFLGKANLDVSCSSATNRITGKSYDSNGNLLNDGSNAMAYDILNQVKSVTNASGRQEYFYDSAGERVATASFPAGASSTAPPSSATYLLRSGAQTVGEESFSYSHNASTGVFSMTLDHVKANLYIGSNLAATREGDLPATSSLAGRVILANQGTGLGGVTVKLSSGASTWSTTTGSDGYYLFTGLPAVLGTLVPASTAYSISPPTRTISLTAGAQVTVPDFTAGTGVIISGKVTAQGSALAVSGATISVTSGGTVYPQAITGVDGSYTVPNLSANSSYSLTPVHSCYSIPAATVAVATANVTKNFVAVPRTFSISCQITSAGTGLTGVTVTAGGQVATTPSAGVYTFNSMPGGQIYTIIPSRAGYTFSPPSLPVDLRNQCANSTGNVFTAATATGTITINGNISGQGINLVTVCASSPNAATPPCQTTGAPGVFSLSGLTQLAAGQSYTVKPTKSGYVYSPLSRSVPGNSSPQTLPTPSFTGYQAACVNKRVVTGRMSITITCPSCNPSFFEGQCFPNTSPNTSTVHIQGRPYSGYSFTKFVVSPVGGTSSTYTSSSFDYPLSSSYSTYTVLGYADAMTGTGPLSATPGGQNETGTYQVLLSWSPAPNEEPVSGALFQVAYRPISQEAFTYSPVFGASYDAPLDLYYTLFDIPLGCKSYVFMVRSYNAATNQVGEWSELVTGSSQAVKPARPLDVTLYCHWFTMDKQVKSLAWRIGQEEACAVTSFGVFESTDGTNYSFLMDYPANGATNYGMGLGHCNQGAGYYKVVARIGDVESSPSYSNIGPGLPPTPTEYSYNTNIARPDVVIGDLTGDSAYDLILQTALFRANPDGTFTDASAELRTTAGDGDRIRIADMNADGLPDRVIARDRTLWVEFNDGGTAFTLGPAYQLGEPAEDFAVGYAPLNVTGYPLVIAGSKSAITFLALPPGGEWEEVQVLETGLDILSLRLADMNNDGLTDILAGGKLGASIFYQVWDGLGAWREEPVAAGYAVPSVDVADANGDGFLDIALARQDKDGPLVYIFTLEPGADPAQRPLAHSWAPAELEAGLDLPNVRQVLFADLERSGLPGVFCVTEEAQKSQYLKNDGMGRLSATGLMLKGKVIAVAAGDFDGDGALDLVAAGNKTLDVYEGVLTAVYVEERGESRRESAGAPWPPAPGEAIVDGDVLRLTWFPGSDGRTPEGALTYEVIAGTDMFRNDLYRGEAGPAYESSRPGNLRTSTRADIFFPGGLDRIFWAVRTVNSRMQKSDWLAGVTWREGAESAPGESIADGGGPVADGSGISQKRHSPCGAAAPAADGNLAPNGAAPPGSHCEATEGRRGNLAPNSAASSIVIPSQSQGIPSHDVILSLPQSDTLEEPALRTLPGHPPKGSRSTNVIPSQPQSDTPEGSPSESTSQNESGRAESFVPFIATPVYTYYAWDHLGTIRIEMNDSGARTAMRGFEPYGLEIYPMPSTGNTHLFTGQERDAMSGLSNLHARFYGSSLGRFMRPDPLDLGSLMKRSLTNPQAWNLYAYVNNNPVNFNDPTGLTIQYSDEWRKKVKNDPVFKKAFEDWKKTETGKAQWKEMRKDKDTVYRLDVGTVKDEQGKEIYGLSNPQNPSRFEYGLEKGKVNSEKVDITINADKFAAEARLMKETPAATSNRMSGTIFHEGCHSLDFGSGALTPREVTERWNNLDQRGFEGFPAGVSDPREEIFRQQLESLPEP